MKTTSLALPFLAASLALTFLAAPLPAAGPAGGNPAADRFNKDLLFYVSFDNGVEAEVSPKGATPLAGKLQEFVKGGGDPFVPGAFGKALKSGEYDLSYDLGDDPQLSQSGSVVHWVASHERKLQDYPYFWTVRLFTGKRMVMFGQMGDPLNKRTLYSYTEGEGQKASAFQGNTMAWEDGDWHLVVVNWRPDAVEVSVDGQPPARGNLKQVVNFEGGTSRLTISSTQGADADTFRIDEVMVLKGPLDAADIEWIHTHGPVMGKPAVPAVKPAPPAKKR